MLNDYKLYRHWYDFTNWTLQKVNTFPKSVRYTISNRISDKTLDILESIIMSIYSGNRLPNLKQINLNLDVLRSLWRIACDNKWLSIRNYEFISEHLNEAGKMTGGWLKSEKSGKSVR